jgi:hypothetical protein
MTPARLQCLCECVYRVKICPVKLMSLCSTPEMPPEARLAGGGLAASRYGVPSLVILMALWRPHSSHVGVAAQGRFIDA